MALVESPLETQISSNPLETEISSNPWRDFVGGSWQNHVDVCEFINGDRGSANRVQLAVRFNTPERS